jgi:hypothetical protein
VARPLYWSPFSTLVELALISFLYFIINYPFNFNVFLPVGSVIIFMFFLGIRSREKKKKTNGSLHTVKHLVVAFRVDGLVTKHLSSQGRPDPREGLCCFWCPNKTRTKLEPFLLAHLTHYKSLKTD